MGKWFDSTHSVMFSLGVRLGFSLGACLRLGLLVKIELCSGVRLGLSIMAWLRLS